MAEMIGVVASAVQLAGTCICALRILQQVKDGPATLRKYQGHFEQLHALSMSISSNPLLQTQEIEEQTKSILSIIKENDLQSLLAKGRFRRILSYIWRDQGFSHLFSELDRRKASLSLMIENTQASAIHDIGQDVKRMVNGGQKTTNTATTPPPSPPASPVPGESLHRKPAAEMSANEELSCHRGQASTSPPVELDSTPISGGPSDPITPPGATLPETKAARQKSRPSIQARSAKGPKPDTPQQLTSEYKNNLAHNVNQVNGDYFGAEADAFDGDMEGVMTIRGRYENNENHGGGNQVNGIEAKIYGRVKKLGENVGVYHGNKAVAPDGTRGGTQFNGRKYMVFKEVSVDSPESMASENETE